MPGHYNHPKPPPAPPKISPRLKKAPSANEEKLQTGSSKKKTTIDSKTGMAEGWGGGAPREGSSKKKWYGTGP